MDTWEKQPWETGPANKAFSDYLSRGHNARGERQERPFMIEWWRQYSGRTQAVKLPGSVTRWAFGLDDSGNKVPGRLTWTERVAAYDEYMEARNRARAEEEMLQQRSRVREIAWQQANMGLESDQISQRALRDLMGLSPKGQRLPTSEEFEGFSPELKKAIAAELGKLGQNDANAGLKYVRADLGMANEQAEIVVRGADGPPGMATIADWIAQLPDHLRPAGGVRSGDDEGAEGPASGS